MSPIARVIDNTRFSDYRGMQSHLLKIAEQYQDVAERCFC